MSNVPRGAGRLPSPPTELPPITDGATTCVGADGNPPASHAPHAALPTRKRNRLKNYDYSQNGRYFITLCTKNKAHLFGNIERGEMVLNPCGLLVKAELERVPEIRAECVVERLVIMPNHLHFILALECVMAAGGLPSTPTPPVWDDGNRPFNRLSSGKFALHPSISNMVQGFKGAVSRALGFSPWQRSFHDHIIRNEADYTRIARYIEENPLRWETDCFFSENPCEDNKHRESC